MPLQIYKIASTTVTSSAGQSSITFSNIPQGYTDLKLVQSLRTNQGGVLIDTVLKFNSSSTGYSERLVRGAGNSAGSFTQSGNNIFWNYAQADTSTANVFSNSELYIPNYTSGNNKAVFIDGVTENNATEAYAFMVWALWSNSSAISSISITTTSGVFKQYSTATLYGVL